MGTSQNQGGAILLRAKGTVAPLDLSTVNQVPRALSWKLVAAWVALIVAGGQAPGQSFTYLILYDLKEHCLRREDQ